MSSMSLQFINKTTIGPEERRLIRSHVMKGKNAGRPRPSRRKHCDTRAVKPKQQYFDTQELRSFDVSLVTRDHMHTLRLKRLLWNDLALTSFPHQVSPQSRELIHQWFFILLKRLYPPEFCAELDVINYVWFKYLLLDKAYFHGILAISASFADFFGGNVKIFPEALSHLSEAYRLTNQRLSGPEAVSDLAIAIVTALAIYQRLHHQQLTGLTHFDGLCRMIEMRGGIAMLAKENRALAQKPWRLDIEFAIQDGSPPHFSADEIASSFTFYDATRISQSFEPMSERLHFLREADSKLPSLMLDTAAFTKVLNSMDKQGKLDPLDYSEAVFSLLHRLLQYAPLGGQRPSSPLDNLVHLTLLALMTTLLPVYGNKSASYELLSNHLRSAAQDFAIIPSHSPEILTWTLYVGRTSVWSSADEHWLLPLVSKACIHQNLHGWSDVRRILCEFSWIHTVGDESGETLWKKAQLWIKSK